MNAWLWAAAAMLAALLPCGITVFRGDDADRLIGLEMTALIIILELVLLAEGIHRPSFYDLPLTLAILSLGGGLVFARFLQRWL